MHGSAACGEDMVSVRLFGSGEVGIICVASLVFLLIVCLNKVDDHAQEACDLLKSQMGVQV